MTFWSQKSTMLFLLSSTVVRSRLLSTQQRRWYNFLQESVRWQQRIDASSATGNKLLVLDPAGWKTFVDDQSSPAIREWLESQPEHGLISVPETLIQDLSSDQVDDSTTALKVLRQPQDATSSDEGLLPPSQQWSALSKVKSWKSFNVSCQEEVRSDVLSFLGSCYSFDRYKSSSKSEELMKLHFPNIQPRAYAHIAGALYWAQDLISTPANDLIPGILQHAVEQWADTSPEVNVETIVGDDLLQYNGNLSTSFGCGMIHAVGRAAASTSNDRQPRLLKLEYSGKGSSDQRPLALVGKGVTYDTGGLNLKPGSSMQNMKKDMGGAALALGLFRALVESGYAGGPVQCWIPCVENSLGNEAFRPGDILTSVNGKTTEIRNTDAEGRLILADALALASAEEPKMMIDFATLTGAQRVAMGLDIPTVFTNKPSQKLMPQLLEAARVTRDPLWQLPLWQPDQKRIKGGDMSDLVNIATDNGLGGAITAALYLQEFVAQDIPWIHVDFNGLDNKTGLGRASTLQTMLYFLSKLEEAEA